jgi:hypothetical protein
MMKRQQEVHGELPHLGPTRPFGAEGHGDFASRAPSSTSPHPGHVKKKKKQPAGVLALAELQRKQPQSR